MVYFLIGLLASVPFWFLWRQTPRDCPSCRRQLPLWYTPWNRTRRQWVKGGYYCQQCQIEVDLQGNRVSEDESPISAAAFWRVLGPALMTPVLVVVVSYFVFFWGKELIRQQAMASDVEAVAPVISRRLAPNATKFGASREELRARIILHEHGLVHGGDLYSFGVEFENLSLGTAATVEFDAEDVKLEVTDERGRIVPLSPTERSGPGIPIRQALIPPCGYTVFSTHDQGMGIPVGQKRFNAGYEAWLLKPGRYSATGSVLVRVEFARNDAPEHVHFAKDQPKLKLTIPAVGFVVSK